jgi:signal transduction histidine kinase
VALAAARHAQDQERASIARELHDVVAHQLSAIAVQAGAARLASASDPDIASAAVAAIEQEARRGLIELNHLVGVLRQGSGAGHSDALPEPRLGDIAGLVERAKGSGLAAALVVDGEPRPLPAAIELAGYRVVQESLTNSIRYAGGASALVRVCYLDDGIVVEVADDGPGGLSSGAGRQGGGFGLAGLGERARLLGGRFEAGRGQERGFVVRAYLPGAR